MSTLRRIATPFALMAAFVAFATLAADRRETRPVAGFTGIALAAPINVELVQGDTESLVLEGDEAALAELETVVEQGVLKIRTRLHFTLRSFSKVRARVGAKSIDALRISGSGDIAATKLHATDLKVAIGGSGDVRIGTLSASRLDISVAGSGDVVVGGKADTVSTSIAGSGDVKAGKLEARDARVSIAGSGDAAVWAKESLKVSILGSGDVRYYGDPSLTRSILGPGSVLRAGAAPS
ncbi:MAG TPA: head GIN domain-containing protein [Usitatibacter sp.]